MESFNNQSAECVGEEGVGGIIMSLPMDEMIKANKEICPILRRKIIRSWLRKSWLRKSLLLEAFKDKGEDG